MSMAVETRDHVRAAALAAGVKLGRPVSLAALINAAVTIAERDPSALAAQIQKENV